MIDFITHNIVFTLLNTFFSIFIGFLITAYYSDNFHFPLVFKKHKILPSGHYNIIAHSRESKSVITWETEIKERFCRSSKITMRTIWADNFTPQTKEEKMWEYTGSIYKQGEYIIAHLNLKHYRVSDAEVNGKNVRRAYRGEDPCFLVFHRRTETWTIQPGILCGFSSVMASCYSSIHILIPKNVHFSEKQKSDLLMDNPSLDYMKYFNKIREICSAHNDFNDSSDRL